MENRRTQTLISKDKRTTLTVIYDDVYQSTQYRDKQSLDVHNLDAFPSRYEMSDKLLVALWYEFHESPNTEETFQLNKQVPSIDLYLCVLYPGGESTPEMDFNYHKLKKIPNINLKTILVKGGEFSHRHPRDVPDGEQCRLRNIYLDKVPSGSWLIVLDSDEVLFGALDNIPQLLHMARYNEMNYIMISEFLPDGKLLLRPRLIYKRDGLSYGGSSQKHDYINHCKTLYIDPRHTIAENGQYCPCSYNYIDVEDESSSMIADFLGFFHYKNGVGLELYSKDRVLDMPANIVKTVEGRLVRETDFKHTCRLCGEIFDFKRDLDRHQQREAELLEIRGGTI